MKVGYLDIWILAINIALFYLGFKAIKLIARASDCIFEKKIIKKWQNNKDEEDNNNKEEQE